MTLDEARYHIGDGVVYTPAHSDREDGVIAAVSSVYVFVQYAGQRGTVATRPEDLVLAEAAGHD